MTPIVITDLDGTLQIGKRVNWLLLKSLQALQAAGYEIMVITYRSELKRLETVRWLWEYGIPEGSLLIAERTDTYNPATAKKLVYEREIRGKYRVMLAIDDQPEVIKMWQTLGFQTWLTNAPVLREKRRHR